MKNKLLGFFVCSLAIFWNMESGILILISWTMLLLLETFYNRKIKNIINIITLSIISVIMCLLLHEIIIFIRVGYFINPKNLFFSIFLFSTNGFLALRLNIIKHPWILLIIVYLYALGKTLKIIIDKNKFDEKNIIKSYITFYGLGIFIYYLERSVILKFFFISVPFIILLSIYVDKNEKTIINYLTKVILLIISFLTIISTLLSTFLHTTKLKTIDPYNLESYMWLKDFSNDIGKDFEFR